jgi:Thaumatin family/Ricin-type beta-trefoil lectin domain
MKMADKLNRILRAASIPFFAALMACSAASQTFTVTNNCGYTVYPGVYPAVYQNGGWEMAPNSSVSFSPGSTFNGRIWGRIGCNSSSPAVCTTGSCGGTGLQCAGTTGVAGTSLAEFNLDASGTDYYDVSYVDGFDNPIGVVVSNSSCTSPNTCTSAPLSECPSGELTDSGHDCLSPCTEYGTDQYCCAGAYNTSATCIVSNWAQPEQSYVTNIHNSCPNEYSYAYDDSVGLHTCATGANYTITFCPNGSGSTGGSGPAAIVNGDTYTVTPQNATGLRLDDEGGSTANGNTIWVYTANSTAAQNWVFNNTGVSPAGYYNIALAGGANCVTASGTGSTSLVNLQPCNGSSAQAWEAVASGSFYVFHPANNTANCLDVQGDGTGSGTLVQVYACNSGNNEEWALTVN